MKLQCYTSAVIHKSPTTFVNHPIICSIWYFVWCEFISHNLDRFLVSFCRIARSRSCVIISVAGDAAVRRVSAWAAVTALPQQFSFSVDLDNLQPRSRQGNPGQRTADYNFLPTPPKLAIKIKKQAHECVLNELDNVRVNITFRYEPLSCIVNHQIVFLVL